MLLLWNGLRRSRAQAARGLRELVVLNLVSLRVVNVRLPRSVKPCTVGVVVLLLSQFGRGLKCCYM